MGKILFWSRDRLVKPEFDCLGLGLGLSLRLWLGLRIMDSFGVMVRVRAGIPIRLYVNTICSIAKP